MPCIFHEYDIPQKVKAFGAKPMLLPSLLLSNAPLRRVFYSRQKYEKRVYTLSDVSLFSVRTELEAEAKKKAFSLTWL